MAPGGDRERLRRIARYQRWVMLALVSNIAVYVLAVSTQKLGPIVALVVLLAALAVVVFTMTSTFLLGMESFGTGLAVLFTVLMCVPCVSLIMLLVLNNKATSLLQQGGLKVGFLGIDPRSI
jgi:hypothetical protein